ncbi:copper chaperone CopZ [Paenibacillus forsythiae]|uniref:Copper chaperone CopZ n=1 Tax=Paenibacillus forsythiae TaxID=365616 RepID=A0ABU3HB78_9BACL|nr:heavy-metal-associated domain-containing protein [Paenibacillus forsythiae]MDT3428078.1 copper chaperone CopZ [Paenibacillus forsythiae]
MENGWNTVISRYTVEGMHCPKCESKIKGELEGINGVKTVEVDREGKRVSVTHAAEKDLAENIRSRIGEMHDGKFTVTGMAAGAIEG